MSLENQIGISDVKEIARNSSHGELLREEAKKVLPCRMRIAAVMLAATLATMFGGCHKNSIGPEEDIYNGPDTVIVQWGSFASHTPTELGQQVAKLAAYDEVKIIILENNGISFGGGEHVSNIKKVYLLPIIENCPYPEKIRHKGYIIRPLMWNDTPAVYAEHQADSAYLANLGYTLLRMEYYPYPNPYSN